MCLAWPENIVYLLLLIPLAVILGYGVMRQLHAREAVAGPRMSEAMVSGVSLKGLVVKKLMLFSGIALLLFALSGPRLCGSGKPVLRKGVDMLFVLDVSRSMMARDVLPDRLGQAKYEVSRISRAVGGGRRAILLFAAAPLVQCPLTTDQDAFEALLGMASPDLIEEQGTVFRSAFELARTLLDPASESGMVPVTKGEKIVVFLSDGEDHSGDLNDAVRRLKKSGVHVFVIGVGLPRPAVIPTGPDGKNIKRDEGGRAVTTAFRAETLRALASDAGGSYFRSRADHAVYGEVTSRINRIAASSRWIMEPAEREPLDHFVLAAAFILLLAESMTGRCRGIRH